MNHITCLPFLNWRMAQTYKIMEERKNIPLDLVQLLPILDVKLMELLRSLTPAEWERQTVAKFWKVKDVVAHLLDGNTRVLSSLRDNYQGETPNIQSYQHLLDHLNGLNADWVKAMKRVSPAMLLLLHETTGKLYCDYYASVDPFGKSPWAVNWAGEEESKNWMHIAREYTEKWLHQQQIRDAVNKPGLLTKEFFYPFIDTFMMALPFTYRDVDADEGTTVALTVSSEIGGSWFIKRENGKWLLTKEKINDPTTQVIVDPTTAWKLFSKSIRPENVIHIAEINGNRALGEKALSMVSVMA
jgi:uncharacterized protein (TIGR03083 family)